MVGFISHDVRGAAADIVLANNTRIDLKGTLAVFPSSSLYFELQKQISHAFGQICYELRQNMRLG
jgi:hypothetical protein